MKRKIRKLKRDIQSAEGRDEKFQILDEFMQSLSERSVDTGHGFGTRKYLSSNRVQLRQLAEGLFEEFGICGLEGCLTGDREEGSHTLRFGFNPKFIPPSTTSRMPSITLTEDDRCQIIRACDTKSVGALEQSKRAYQGRLVAGIDGTTIPHRLFECCRFKGFTEIDVSENFRQACSQYNSAFLSTVDDYISQLSDVEYSYVQGVEVPLLPSRARRGRQENYQAGLFQQQHYQQQSDTAIKATLCGCPCAVL
ncbi:hypothetical protein ACGP04_07795 [Piscirickettsia salmonis]|uniref:hypothetical protein n=1 Tax=Piscirickettsia salmonis TaxID=1238 RepID=UPI000F07C72D|nr:hypothetical protein DA717_08400 [Piscirickettsiaceae bacterium NZ-RLO2]